MKRAEAFLGVHFDFHAGEDCDQVGARTTPEMVELVIDKVNPDYIQVDCKGHLGYSSYPTKVGNPALGFVGDPLKVWRQRDIPAWSGACHALCYNSPRREGAQINAWQSTAPRWDMMPTSSPGPERAPQLR